MSIPWEVISIMSKSLLPALCQWYPALFKTGNADVNRVLKMVREHPEIAASLKGLVAEIYLKQLPACNLPPDQEETIRALFQVLCLRQSGIAWGWWVVIVVLVSFFASLIAYKMGKRSAHGVTLAS